MKESNPFSSHPKQSWDEDGDENEEDSYDEEE